MIIVVTDDSRIFLRFSFSSVTSLYSPWAGSFNSSSRLSIASISGRIDGSK
jgi:hypothetical protein